MKYSKKQVKRLADKFSGSRYTRIGLPYGIHTNGNDRSHARNIIFPESLAGKTVLDIGCAYGYFCFEAEKLGAKKVVGMDWKSDRMERARLFGDVLESNVEFREVDAFSHKFEEQYDYVLLLNILHHHQGRWRKLMERFMGITRERFAIESPRLKGKSLREIMKGYQSSFDKIDIFPSQLRGPGNGKRQIAICQK